MRVVVETRITGGEKLKTLMRKARRQGEHEISAGFYTGQIYPAEGRRRARPLAQVAAWNEWGTPTIPERPFMRPVLGWLRTPGVLPELMRPAINVETGELRVGPAIRIAEALRSKIRENIKRKIWPANAPFTIAKKGFNNPLIETRRMLNGVKTRVWMNAPRARRVRGGRSVR